MSSPSTEKITHLSDKTRKHCESCGAKAAVKLGDGSTWCAPCDGAARKSGY